MVDGMAGKHNSSGICPKGSRRVVTFYEINPCNGAVFRSASGPGDDLCSLGKMHPSGDDGFTGRSKTPVLYRAVKVRKNDGLFAHAQMDSQCIRVLQQLFRRGESTPRRTNRRGQPAFLFGIDIGESQRGALCDHPHQRVLRAGGKMESV